MYYLNDYYWPIVGVSVHHIGNDWYVAKYDIFIDMTTVTKIVEKGYSQLNIGECINKIFSPKYTGHNRKVFSKNFGS